MTDFDRTTAPEFREIEKVEILRQKKNYLSNGIPVFMINAGTEDVIKIDLIFNAGIWASFCGGGDPSPLLASTVNHLLQEGTSTMTSSEIAERIDFFGAFIQAGCGKDNASVSLLTLARHLKSTLPILEEIINDAVFPEKELEIYLQNSKQKFIVDSEKVHVISRRKFNEVIFGKRHPYGKNACLKDFETLSREELKSFYGRYYSAGNCQIIVSGKINEEVLPLLESHFGNWGHTGITPPVSVIKIVPSSEKTHFVKRENQVQSSLCIGRPLFSKNHPDYAAMKVLNVLLGGYFGSRLMANIREEKGYTYGIGSAVFPLIHEGCFFISTEVGQAVTGDALKEIYAEIQRLISENVTQEELQKVRNYMMGEFLRSVDGPFALADKFKGILFFGLDYDYYDNYIRTIKNISPENIRDLAQKYLRKDDLFEVVVGS